MVINVEQKEEVSFIYLTNKNKMSVVLSTYGASFYDLIIPDKENNLESVILTPSNLDDFYNSTGYFGKTVGRFSGRIDNAMCEINNVKYDLDKNWNGVNSLHGGYKGISFANFDYCICQNDEYTDVVFFYEEKENQLPGDVKYKIRYRIMENNNEINLMFNAISTKDTLVNLTNHVYFNLSGNGKRDCLNQLIQFNCDKYTKLNNNLITISVDKVNNVMDFRKMHKLGDFIYDESLQNHTAKGYDHCFIKEDMNKPEIAVMQDDISGRKLTVKTSYPTLVCYSGCYPVDVDFNKEKFKIKQYYSVCLECQYIPNGINMENEDSAMLKKGEEYNHYITYSFDILK